VREYLEGWSDLVDGCWPDATLTRRQLHGNNSPARTNDGGQELSTARTRADIRNAAESLNSTARTVVVMGIFQGEAPVIGERRDWRPVARQINLPVWEAYRIYCTATRTMAYFLGWRPRQNS